MIIYPQALVLSEQEEGRPLTYPRIGYQTWTRESGVTVSASSEIAGGPRDAPLRPDTAEYWEPESLPATWTVDLGSARDIDYVGIAGHTLGSNGAALEVRLSEDTDFDSHVSLPGEAGDYASTPDSADISITGDLDLRVKQAATDYTPAAEEVLLGKWNTTGNQRSYRLSILTSGVLRLAWSADGAAEITKDSTAATALSDATKKWLRATLDVDNGAAGNDVKFWMSDDGVAWSQLGSTVTTGGTTSVFDGTAALELSGHSGGTALHYAGKIYYAEVRNGIGGAVAAAFDPDQGENGDTSFQAETGETWTINQDGVLHADLVVRRFAFELQPDDDAPLVFLDTMRTARHMQLTVSGPTVPQIAVVYVGELLAMPRRVAGGYQPITLSRETMLTRALSRGGQFLGQSFRRMGVVGSAAFQHLDEDWYRANFDPFVKSARRFPFFFMWNPEQFPGEVVYGWCEQDIRPAYMNVVNQIEVNFPIVGIGNE